MLAPVEFPAAPDELQVGSAVFAVKYRGKLKAIHLPDRAESLLGFMFD